MKAFWESARPRPLAFVGLRGEFVLNLMESPQPCRCQHNPSGVLSCTIPQEGPVSIQQSNQWFRGLRRQLVCTFTVAIVGWSRFLDNSVQLFKQRVVVFNCLLTTSSPSGFNRRMLS
ncbi:hypothetical protein B0H12DRAFT_451686 [Mycena haematopus]|nr:hypothetical protein B0H12DRAFT_451686 [Mycena haematopus]